jgi:hypothetical protein
VQKKEVTSITMMEKPWRYTVFFVSMIHDAQFCSALRHPGMSTQPRQLKNPGFWHRRNKFKLLIFRGKAEFPLPRQ